MKVDVGAAISQANRLSQYASSLDSIKGRMLDFKGDLNHGWKAKEITLINNAIDNINREISQLHALLLRISPDIIEAAYEIRKEEEAREAAERAAAEKAAAEREARLQNMNLR
ncbi:hypothetical protein [Bacillus sp. REN3]|uniref:hypothetical protein n=1 Tax=Bacillus sp. REN3 TaxID=2802440 RepID=UPI001AEEF99F|nr:hypothetical protein [Bacillus sp. REN3]